MTTRTNLKAGGRAIDCEGYALVTDRLLSR